MVCFGNRILSQYARLPVHAEEVRDGRNILI